MRVHELHAPVKVVQRSKGRSATAAAAYRAGVSIEDERTGVVHDYTRKRGIEGEALLLPENAPEWAHDRSRLWNAAEQREKHPRAQTARDLTVAFPSEFNQEQRQEAGLRIGQWLVVRYGAAVDVAWHEPSKKGDQRNHHAHLLFTTRRFDQNGQWAETKDRTLDDLKKGPEEITVLRLGVADVLNNIAARDRLEVYVEHLSFEKRGLDQEATQHLGPIATEMEREGMATDIGDKNREIQARNKRRQELREEQKVVEIELARERLEAARKERDQRRQAAAAKAERDAQADAYEEFYRETQERRTALLSSLDQQHGGKEKELRQQIAGLADARDKAGFFARIWRAVTGRTRAERQQMDAAARILGEIQRERQIAHEDFERERVIRLEALKAAAQARELERQAEAEPLARVAGDPPAGAVRPAEMKANPAPDQKPDSEYEARRRAYFQRLGAQRKRERENERPGQDSKETPHPRVEEEPTARQKEQSPSPALPSSSDRDYEARKREYMRRSRRQRQEPERDEGPRHEPG